ncbi:FtsX-like permease family protein [Maribellus comscasis]|uniref:FtsX-like permease family protein n=1 Tax=Maribellus comscasis TaxID=2681766 RepID=A0A6I6JZY3_9BACT|nr:ABC transporter permease [Maribellus comscasis]QGY44683.1 FtsX-like permease family protein [Maribellus comscasis]
MLKHYLKYAIRNFKSNRLVFAGSIATVFLGALCISLLFTYIRNELSMDNFHKREKDIYLITLKDSPESKPEAWEADLFFKFNYKDYPEIESFTDVKKYREGEIKFTYNEHSFSPEGIVADSSFFEVFDFPLKVGDKAAILHDPDAIIFSQNMAKKIFGDENPIGKYVTITTREQKIYTVKGILDPLPSNSSITFDFIIPNHSMQYSRMGGNFILANSNFNEVEFYEKIKGLGHYRERFKESTTGIYPLSKMYFEGNNINTQGIISKHGDKKNINVLYVIIAVIFIISLLNFTNLQIININFSIKNIGINKITGAGSKHILLQKFTEILLLIFVSSFIVTLAFHIVLPYFNQIARVNLSPDIRQIFFLNSVILFVLITGAMIYPSFVYFYLPVTKSLKNQTFAPTKLAGREVLTTLQFTLSFVLLIASIVVVKQLNLMLDKDLGFESKNIVSTQLFHEPNYSGTREEQMKQHQDYQNNFQYVKNELTVQSSIKSFSIAHSPIQPFDMSWKLNSNEMDFTTEKSLVVTPGYTKLLGLKILEGRFFDFDKDKSYDEKVVINEAAKKYWGITDISTQQIKSSSWGTYDIIGVVKDFNFEHLSVEPQPLVMVYFERMHYNFLIQFEEGANQAGLQFVRQLFEKNNPGETFNYTFLSDDIQSMYNKEKRLSEIYILFTIIAYIISAIGLFAITLYETRKRIKEIGIRKVNGAKITEVITMLNKDFVKWVVFAFVVATPISYYIMHKWLENFAYKTTLSWWIFALAGLMALGIALLTVSWQSWKAAAKNPVEALRYE